MELKPGYKQTEVGMIPEDWDMRRLGECARFRTGPFGSALHKSDYTDDGVPVINPMHIGDGRIEPTHSMTITEKVATNLPDFRLKTGEIVIGRRGDMGRCAVVQAQQAGWLCGTGSMIVRCDKGADADFVQRVLSSPQAIAAIEDTSVGTTMVNLNQSTLAGLRIQFPPLPEQRAIAMALSDVDALLDALERLIAKKRDLKQATMQQLLTGQTRLPGFGKRLPIFQLAGFGRFPTDWELTPLSRVSAFITKGSTPTTYGFHWVRSGILFLRSECVSEQGLDFSEAMFITSQAHRFMRRSEARAGDLLITITGNVGRVLCLGTDFPPCNINQHVARIRIIDNRIAPSFVFHFLSQPIVRKYYNQITTGQAYPQISLTQVRDTVLPMPPLEEQTAIAGVLTDMDAELDALDQRLAKTRALKQAMIQELLTGKTRLVSQEALHA